MGLFGKGKPNAGKIHATKAGRFLADVERESKKSKDEVAAQRDKKQQGGKK